ncbi:MAG: hypothetical protein ABI882_14065 [Acidobacteriota bacterium]
MAARMAIPGIRLRRPALLAVSSAFVVLFLLPLTGSTHEPITTNVRFNKEIIRILEKNCLACHSPGKMRGDISLTTYEEARPWAKAIKEEVLEKRMPPYQAVRGFGSFVRNYGLSQREIDLLVSWVEGGAPKGDAKDLPPAQTNQGDWVLGQPDLILRPSKETRLAANQDSMTTCFLLNTNLKEDRWISGLEFKAGNESVVHSATISLADAGSVRNSRKAARSCPPVSSKEEILGSWVPGQNVARLPAGVGRLIPRGSNIVVRIRYHANAEPAVDLSSIGLFFSLEPPDRQVTSILMTAPTNLAPATQPLRVTSSQILGVPSEAIGLRPIPFPFAKSIEVTAYRPDGTREVLIWVRDRRYDWSPSYSFKKPVTLPEGTRIEVVAYLDNSAENPNNPNDPPKAIRFAAPLCEVFLSQGIAAKMASTASRN